MTPEVHAVIVWSTALDATDRIVADLRERFELVGSYRVEWTRERFAENLRRLYGFALPERVDKTVGSGTDPFLLLVARDPSPEYGPRKRSWGLGLANVATYDAKYRFREWTGGGFRVHTTISREEAARDVFLLLGRRAESFLTAPALDWDREPDGWRSDVLGAAGWRSRDELLTALELTTGYALLRDPDLLLTGDAGWARDLVGEEVEVRVLDSDGLPDGWRGAIVREAVPDARGHRLATPEHAFHALLHYALDGEVPVDAAELRRLAVAAGASEADYADPDFARATLDEFLHRNGWLAPRKRRRLFGRGG